MLASDWYNLTALGGMAEARHPARQGCGLLAQSVSTGLVPGGLEGSP